MKKANLNTWKSVYDGLKYLIIPAIITNYFEVLYGGYLSIAFIMLAAIFKALADTSQHHFNTSVLRDLSPLFFDPNISYKKPTIFGYRIDFWHLCNSLMIVSFCSSMVCYASPNARWADVLLAGYYFNVTFSLFYDIILRRK